MKKLLKSGICGSINSTWCTVGCRKVSICGYCSLNSTWTVTAFLQNAWKKKSKTQNADGSKRRRVSKLGLSLSKTMRSLNFHYYPLQNSVNIENSTRERVGFLCHYEVWNAKTFHENFLILFSFILYVLFCFVLGGERIN